MHIGSFKEQKKDAAQRSVLLYMVHVQNILFSFRLKYKNKNEGARRTSHVAKSPNSKAVKMNATGQLTVVLI